MTVASRVVLAAAALLLASATALAGGMPPEIEIDANGVPIDSDVVTAASPTIPGKLASPTDEARLGIVVSEVVATADTELLAAPIVERTPTWSRAEPPTMKKDHR